MNHANRPFKFRMGVEMQKCHYQAVPIMLKAELGMVNILREHIRPINRKSYSHGPET